MELRNMEQEYRSVSVVFYALITGVVLFIIAASTYIATSGRLMPDLEYRKILLIVSGALSSLCLLAAFSQYNKRINSMESLGSTSDDRFQGYRNALVTFLALCEAPALFSIIALLLTGDYLFLAFTVVMLLCMFSKKPTKDRF
ncbi:MAG TPA: hypothetical protein VD996_11715, partial [Chitinophagaceae bacterium]|nr:hypothetical protein [Chitinophagaceae bacterium]